MFKSLKEFLWVMRKNIKKKEKITLNLPVFEYKGDDELFVSLKKFKKTISSNNLEDFVYGYLNLIYLTKEKEGLYITKNLAVLANTNYTETYRSEFSEEYAKLERLIKEFISIGTDILDIGIKVEKLKEKNKIIKKFDKILGINGKVGSPEKYMQALFKEKELPVSFRK